MPVRVRRMICGRVESAMVTVGMTKCQIVSWPDMGNHRSATPNSNMNISPNQKLGIAWPNTASTRDALSTAVF